MSAIGTKRTCASCTAHVRFRGQSGHDCFALHMSAFDPKRTLPSHSRTNI